MVINHRGMLVVVLSSMLVVSCVMVNRARSQEATETVKPTYQEVLKKCGGMWKGSEERKAADKGAGREAWQAFFAMCKKDQGFQKKNKGKV